ncbi:glycosyltransferase family 2 protein, partial [Soehngenia saccharolytica]
MKISIIIPVYNSTLYLKQCVESILAQTYHNFEILLVDDGSTDDSPMICDEY